MQVFQPWVQRRKLAYAEHKHVIFGFLRQIRKRALGKLLTDDGEIDNEMVEKLVLLHEPHVFFSPPKKFSSNISLTRIYNGTLQQAF